MALCLAGILTPENKMWEYTHVVERDQDAAECTRIRVLVRHSETGEERTLFLKFAFPPIDSQIDLAAERAALILNSQ